jgi:hypothetical protein
LKNIIYKTYSTTSVTTVKTQNILEFSQNIKVFSLQIHTL